MIEHCEHEQLATVLVNTATVVRLPCLPPCVKDAYDDHRAIKGQLKI